MAELIIEKHKWQPDFKNEIWITDKRRYDNFTITLKQDNDIEIEFNWDYDYGGRGTESMTIPVELLKSLIDELDKL